MHTQSPLAPGLEQDHQDVGDLAFERFEEQVRAFHGYAAPGVLLGGYMVEATKAALPAGILYDAVSETAWCLPDAVQMLTPCTVGNGWLRILNFGIYAVSLFDKRTGEGVRVCLEPSRMEVWPEMATWHLKLKPKKDQDSARLREEIRRAGASVCSVLPVRVRPEIMEKRSKGAIVVCPLCGAAYPASHGKICRPCRGESPYARSAPAAPEAPRGPRLRLVPVDEAVGHRTLHDMTRIVPGESKAPAFLRGQVLEAGDVCRLQRMGRQHIYVEDEAAEADQAWVHEDEAAEAFAMALAGPGTEPVLPPREGKVNIRATRDGLLVVDHARLEAFNLVPEVMAATRKDGSLVKAGMAVAGTRAIPLHLLRTRLSAGLAILDDGPLVRVAELRPLKVGVLVTGTEVHQGLIQDKFAPLISSKAAELGASVVATRIVPDDAGAIRKAVQALLAAGSQMVVTTAGLSVDPDDVTRRGLAEAGATDMIHGTPFLPGAMLLTARIGDVPVVGVPACALFFQATAFDVVFPRILAGLPVDRTVLARLGHGGMCMECKTCRFPKCSFGR